MERGVTEFFGLSDKYMCARAQPIIYVYRHESLVFSVWHRDGRALERGHGYQKQLHHGRLIEEIIPTQHWRKFISIQLRQRTTHLLSFEKGLHEVDFRSQDVELHEAALKAYTSSIRDPFNDDCGCVLSICEEGEKMWAREIANKT